MDEALTKAQAEIDLLQSILHSYAQFFIVFDVIFIAALVVILVLAIIYLKSNHKLRRSRSYIRYTIRGQEEERGRIARELHDTVAQDLRYCRMLSDRITDKPLKNEISALLDKSVKQVRSMSYNLAPPDVTKNDLRASLVNLCHNFQEYCPVNLRLIIPDSVDMSFLNAQDVFNLYRMIQESLTNIKKHADASEVTLLLRNQLGTEEAGLYIFITDDGVGFKPEARKVSSFEANHLGLEGMEQRALYINARLEVNSQPGEGTQITIIKPAHESKNGRML